MTEGIHQLAKRRICPECQEHMYRSQIRYRTGNKTEHYQCPNEYCMAKVRIITKTKTAIIIHKAIIEMERKNK